MNAGVYILSLLIGIIIMIIVFVGIILVLFLFSEHKFIRGFIMILSFIVGSITGIFVHIAIISKYLNKRTSNI